MQMETSMVQTSTQYTVHREQRLGGGWPPGARNATQEAHGLIKTVEGVYMQSMSHADELKKRGQDVGRLQQDLQRALQENEQLKAKTLEEERSRISDSTMKEELLNNRVIMDGIVSAQTELKGHMKQYGMMAHDMKETNQHRSKRLEEYGHYIEGIKEKQRERKELKKKILTMQRANNEMQDKLADSEEALSEQRVTLANTSESLLALQKEKAADDKKSLELLGQLQAKLAELKVLSLEKEALVLSFSIDLNQAEAAGHKSTAHAAETEEARKSTAAELAVARDELAMRQSMHELQQNASAGTITELELRVEELQSKINSQEAELCDLQQKINSLALAGKTDADAHELKTAELILAHGAELERATQATADATQRAGQLAQEKLQAEQHLTQLEAELGDKLSASEQACKAQAEQIQNLETEGGKATNAARAALAETVAARQEGADQLATLSKELEAVRLSHQLEAEGAQSHNQQQLLNLRGQLDALETDKKRAASAASEAMGQAKAEAARLGAEHAAALGLLQGEAKQLSDKVQQADSALAGEKATVAAAATRASELEATLASLREQAAQAASRAGDSEGRVAALEAELAQQAQAACEHVSELEAQLASLKQEVHQVHRAQRQAGGAEPFTFAAPVMSEIAKPKPSSASPAVDHSKVVRRRATSASASKRSFAKASTPPAVPSVPSIPPTPRPVPPPPTSRPELPPPPPRTAPPPPTPPPAPPRDPPAAAAPRIRVDENSPRQTGAPPASARSGGPKPAAVPPASVKRATPAPIASAAQTTLSSARRFGGVAKKKVQKVSASPHGRTSDIFDFD